MAPPPAIPPAIFSEEWTKVLASGVASRSRSSFSTGLLRPQLPRRRRRPRFGGQQRQIQSPHRSSPHRSSSPLHLPSRVHLSMPLTLLCAC